MSNYLCPLRTALILPLPDNPDRQKRLSMWHSRSQCAACTLKYTYIHRYIHLSSTTSATTAMASPASRPLLGAPARKTRSGRLLIIFFLVAIVVSIAAIVSTYVNSGVLLSPTHLCSKSPKPSSCRGVVAESLLYSDTNSRPSSSLQTVRSIVARMIHNVDATAKMVKGRGSSTAVPAVADCIHLLDLSRDRLSASAATDNSEEAQTLLSAVMSFHDTCLDGLRGGAVGPEMEARIVDLQEMASAALAVVATMRSPLLSRALLRRLPAWLPEEDRRLVEEDPKTVAATADAVVAKDGSGKYSTIQAAVDAAPSNSASRYLIYVKKGTYKETVRVGKKQKNVMIMGDGVDQTIVTGSLNVVDGSTTFNSATLASDADGLILQDLTVENTAGAAKHQAVALRVSGDKSVVNRCKIAAYQDTLYNHALRQFFRDCDVSGTVDFIFGNAAVVLQNCKIVARKPDRGQKNAVTAQGRTDPNQNTGTSIQGCRVVPASDLAPVAKTFPTYLGRPWKVYSRTVFMQSFIDGHVPAAGWLEWDGTLGLDTLYYGEYANTGPGAGTSGRVKWKGYHVLSKSSEAVPFTVDQLVQGSSWIPATGVSFKGGL